VAPAQRQLPGAVAEPWLKGPTMSDPRVRRPPRVDVGETPKRSLPTRAAGGAQSTAGINGDHVAALIGCPPRAISTFATGGIDAPEPDRAGLSMEGGLSQQV
jgi:hypothetical protein